MPVASLPFRQVHLDFHTSPDIPEIAADFDPERFADRLARAHVNSVTVFARCHHGYVYYPSKAHPERVHPNLKRPGLLVEQINALHDRGIQCPIYTTVQWDQYTADRHPDWVHTDAHGKPLGTEPYEPGFYRFLDVTHPGYRAFLRTHIDDMFACLPAIDGLFLDIVQPRESSSPHWVEAMLEAGLDPESARAREDFALKRYDTWKLECSAQVRGHDPACRVFYNAGHIGPTARGGLDAYTHLEMESLPTGGWGYMHFPTSASYVRNLGKPTLGMTGKFHTTWGDFYSYKNPEALEFECFKMLAMGAVCSVGDQLPPRGRLDDATYDLIGGVYAQVEAKEPWCDGTLPVADIAVLSAEEFNGQAQPEFSESNEADRETGTARGVVRMFEELGLQFLTLDTAMPLDGFRLVVLPDIINVDDALHAKLKAFVDAGGSLLVTGRSGFDHDAFSRDLLGVEPVGPAPFSPDFLVPGVLGKGLPDVGHVMYQRGVEVKALPGTDVLSEVQRPYFNRTWRHFCSHRHTPSSFETVYPGVTQRGSVIYFAHPVFDQYDDNAPQWCKTLVRNAVARLMPDPITQHDGPSTVCVHLNDQPGHGRYVLHVLHYVPVRKGAIDVIEDRLPLHELELTLRLPKAATRATWVPAGESIDLAAADGAQRITLPKVVGHAMIELPYGS